jgi:hypothetical protein
MVAASCPLQWNQDTWADVFGTSRRADEIFEARQYSQYIVADNWCYDFSAENLKLFHL